MTKLKTDPIKKSDIEAYLSLHSDFGFELSVLKMLRDYNIDCKHGGHYVDPVTSKSREFDIRAMIKIEDMYVRMAIECKNIRDNFPIVICCTPRQAKESYQHIAVASDHKKDLDSLIPIFHNSWKRANVYVINDMNGLYRTNDPVGKSTIQVGRAISDGSISANDSEFYDKWGQCLNSANDLIEQMFYDKVGKSKFCFSTVIPFVVVPNERLWMVCFDENGCKSNPTMTDRVSCYVGKEYEMGHMDYRKKIQISHVEVVTVDGLKSFIENNLLSHQNMEKIFSRETTLKKSNRFFG